MSITLIQQPNHNCTLRIQVLVTYHKKYGNYTYKYRIYGCDEIKHE